MYFYKKRPHQKELTSNFLVKNSLSNTYCVSTYYSILIPAHLVVIQLRLQDDDTEEKIIQGTARDRNLHLEMAQVDLESGRCVSCT